jgi:proteasome lid subunit RPN8/RPN11
MTVAEVALSAAARAMIEHHAEETYPHECCGGLYGEATDAGFAVVEAVPFPNTTSEGPRRRFLIQPSDYRAAEAHARTTGRALVGFYHSHPDHPSRPSQYDLDHAWPNMIYTITSVREGRAELTTAWQLREDRSQFDERTLEG